MIFTITQKNIALLVLHHDAKIVPVKALWFGDTVYGWLWAAGFDNNEQIGNFQENLELI